MEKDSFEGAQQEQSELQMNDVTQDSEPIQLLGSELVLKEDVNGGVNDDVVGNLCKELNRCKELYEERERERELLITGIDKMKEEFEETKQQIVQVMEDGIQWMDVSQQTEMIKCLERCNEQIGSLDKQKESMIQSQADMREKLNHLREDK